MIALPPFLLHEPVGQGGVCEVWRGEHQRQGIPVAVKVLSQQMSQLPRYVQLFREEVRSVAAMSHPAIVQVFDVGEIPEEAATLSQGRLTAKSPYLVMELAEGTLVPRVGKMPWRALYPILLSLLNGLAHAHANGLVHRDIKPANLLQLNQGSQVKLTDFGLVYPMTWSELPQDAEEISGTPSYMAPEQFESHWRDYGPWTDLYALGCTTYALLSGKPPYGSGAFQSMLYAHLCTPTPNLPAHADAPPGMNEWLHKMMAKEPWHRFQRAADAAWALSQIHALYLPEERFKEEASPTVWLQGLSEESAEVPEATIQMSRTEFTDHVVSSAQQEREPIPTEEESNLWQHGPPALPEEWPVSALLERSIQLTEVGLGLFGLRPMPLMGRDMEKACLWETLHEVVEERHTRVITLEGPSGYGKSRLAAALCEHAHQHAAAIPLQGLHHDLEGPTSGLGPMLLRYFQCVGLSRVEIRERLKRKLEDETLPIGDYQALTEIIAPFDGDKTGEHLMVRFSQPSERYASLEQCLKGLCSKRPVVMWLDDIQWGLDSLQFVKHLLSRQERNPLPILILMTLRREALADRDAEAKVLEELYHNPLVEQIEVGPLDQKSHASLIRNLLMLQGDLAQQVEQRTAGNPLFARQLVGDWVERGILTCDESGFQLQPGEQVEVPDDIHQVWLQRILRAIEGRPTEDLYALELAAALGIEVVRSEWQNVCEQAGFQASNELVERLLQQGLVESLNNDSSFGWSFVHGMLRESLERNAKEAGRWNYHNRACAQMIEKSKVPGKYERIGRHMLLAGQPKLAIEPLLRGLRERLDAHELPQVRTLLDEWLALLHQVEWPQEHSHWGEAWLLEARYARALGFYKVGQEWAERAWLGCQAHQWSDLYAISQMWMGYYSWLSGGDATECWKNLREAEQLARQNKDLETLLACYRCIGDFLVSRGDLDEAATYFHRALKEASALGNEITLARACYGLAMVERQTGQHDKAWRWAEEAGLHFEKAGHRRGISDCLNVFGDLARMTGKLDEAETYYTQGISLSQSLGTGNDALFELNLGLTLLERKNYSKARVSLERSQANFAWQKRTLFEGATHLTLLPCIAHDQDWTAWTNHIDKAKMLLQDAGFFDIDLAQAITLAGEIAESSGTFSRAKEAYELAIQQWKGLERNDQIERLLQRIQSLPPMEPDNNKESDS